MASSDFHNDTVVISQYIFKVKLRQLHIKHPQSTFSKFLILVLNSDT